MHRRLVLLLSGVAALCTSVGCDDAGNQSSHLVIGTSEQAEATPAVVAQPLEQGYSDYVSATVTRSGGAVPGTAALFFWERTVTPSPTAMLTLDNGVTLEVRPWYTCGLDSQIKIPFVNQSVAQVAEATKEGGCISYPSKLTYWVRGAGMTTTDTVNENKLGVIPAEAIKLLPHISGNR